MISHFPISSFLHRRRVIDLRNVAAFKARLFFCGFTALCLSIAGQSCLVLRLGLRGGRLLILLLVNATVPRQNTIYITTSPNSIIERTF